MSSEQTSHLLLIVESSPTQREKLRHMLEKHDFRVESAADGCEAMTLLRRIKPIAVISGINMPGIDGYELCRLIKGEHDPDKTAVILLTSFSDPQELIMGLECGADYFIMKPCNETLLLSGIRHILANRNMGTGQRPATGLEVFFRGKKYFINSDRPRILNLLLSTYETAIQSKQELMDLNVELTAQRELASEAMRRAEAASRPNSDFLANMSHELRTPLNSVIGFSEVLEDELFGPLNAKQREYVDNILSSGRHLLNLINDILDLSKMETGNMTLELSNVNLRPLIAGLLIMFQEKALKHNLRLDLELPVDCDIELIADEKKLKRILFNLLSNAVKYTPDGGSVRVAARRVSFCDPPEPGKYWPGQKRLDAEKFVEISVEDSGIGIRREDIPKLFRKSSQIDSIHTAEFECPGLGLVLTRRMVELHGGLLGVESEIGRGSRFFFTIPLQRETAAIGELK